MKSKRFSDEIEELKFTSNKMSDCVDFGVFDSLERRKIREAQDIFDNKVSEMEKFKDEKEYWS